MALDISKLDLYDILAVSEDATEKQVHIIQRIFCSLRKFEMLRCIESPKITQKSLKITQNHSKSPKITLVLGFTS